MMTTNDLFSQFQQHLTAAGGEVHSAANLVQAAELIASHPALMDGQIIVPPGFAAREPWSAIVPLLSAKNIVIREADTPASIADAPAGLSCAELAIAETGSVLLADNALAARIVSMLTLTHFVLVQRSTLFPMLEDAGKLIQQLTKAGPDQQHYITLITGPSRTADIERILTIGVQGPKSLCVLVV